MGRATVWQLSTKRKSRDDLSIQWQCRVTCGADVIIGHVLPFLITARDKEILFL
jgi:hypothetical protein